ncbi:MAG: peptidylprolyl isomerase [Saprospiraceae bacterium]|nr:peptidylprolyl isomerase [Saprospiraceae bacterium]
MINNRMIKKPFLIALILMSSILTGFGQTYLIDKVVAKVGGEFILLSEVEDEFSYAKTKDPSLSDDIKCMILENLIAQKIIVYQAKLDSVDVTAEEVELQLDYRFESVLRQMNGDEEFFKDYYGASVSEMKDRYRDDQKQKLLAEKMQYKLISEVEITPREVEKFFNSIPKDSLPYFKSDMEIAEIVMKPQVNPTERQKALDKITDLRAKIVNNEADFSTLASKHSQDPGSALRGGDLGFAKRGSYVPEFEATVFSLTKDEISDVIETEYGYHIIQLIERRGNSVRAKHILIKPEITEDDLAKTRSKLDSVRTLIVSDSLNFERAVKLYSTKALPSYSNNGRVKNQNTNNTFFAADDLDPDTYFAIFELKTGEISKPLEISLPGGEKAYRLVQLQSINKPHRASLKEDYDKITNFAKENKKNEYFMTWLEKKRKETFVQLDPVFKHCEEIISKSN